MKIGTVKWFNLQKGYGFIQNSGRACLVDVGSGSRRGGVWNWVGVVSGLFNPNDSGVVFFGWYPALRASRLEPVEAIRFV